MKKIIVLTKPTFPLPDDQIRLIRIARKAFSEVVVIVPVAPNESADIPPLDIGGAIKRQIEAEFARKILICGLSGSGKTYLAELLAPAIGAIHLNNDTIRDGPHEDYGWEPWERASHARRVGQWADMLVAQGHDVIVDMICPTVLAREALDPDYVIYMGTETGSQYLDTDKMFVKPTKADYIVTSKSAEIWTRTLSAKLARRIQVVVFEGIAAIDLITP
jgi:hypothetical protein